MPTIQQTLLELEEYVIPLQEARDKLSGLRMQNFTNEKAYEKRKKSLEGEISELESAMETLLKDLEREPDRLYRVHSLTSKRSIASGAG